MSLKYTERTAATSIVTSELNSLTDDTAALITTPRENGDSTARNLLADYRITVAEQGSARGADAEVSLLIVPEVNATYGDTATLRTASNYIARLADGSAATFALDAAVTAREITVSGVQVPNGDYQVGLLNATGQALAATGNVIYETGRYSTEDA